MNELPSNKDDALHEALWFALMCRCDKCGEFYDLGEIDHLVEEDTSLWANEAVRLVKPIGWTSPHGEGWRSLELNCPACSDS